MRTTTTFIRQHIFRIPPDQIFATREFLNYGTRAAVDFALWYLVKQKVIVRLARGVFIRAEAGSLKPAPQAVAEVKAKAFGKQIATYGGDLAYQFQLRQEPNPKKIFCINGASSSFQYGSTTIHFKRTGPRQLVLAAFESGAALRALWHIGKDQIDQSKIVKATIGSGRQQREQLRQLIKWLPAWLSSHLLFKTIVPSG